MIDLKLAEYDLETGKFVKFLELGNDFLFGRNFIEVWFEPKIREGLQIQISTQDLIEEGTYQHYDIDQKDPLNRFNNGFHNLFNGRTYGDGRYVLIMDNQDDIFYCTKDNPVPKKEGNIHENPELFKKISILS